jgi:PAS domain S-box-containing protein
MAATNLGRLLIADDEAELLAALAEGLSARGYEVAAVPSGPEALRLLAEREFDLLLTDLMMPGMDGVSLLREALVLDPNLVGIILTGQGTVSTAVEAMKSGAFDYVLKPFKLQNLLPVLARAMAVRRLRDENLQLRETVGIYELGQAITHGLDPGVVLAKFADCALEQCEADEVSVMVPTTEDHELIVVAVRGEGREGLVGERVALDRGIAGWVAGHRQALLLQGEIVDRPFAPIRPRPEIRSAIVYPLVASEKLVGILNVNTTRHRPFNLGIMKGLGILANIAAVALEGANLHAAALQSEDRYRRLADNAPDLIFRYRLLPTRAFEYVNPASTSIMGYTPEEYLADPDLPLKIVHPDDRARLGVTLQGAGPVDTEPAAMRWIRKDGTIVWTEDRTVGVLDGAGNLVAIEGIVRDVTSRVLDQRALRESEERLRQAQKMESIGLLAGGIAHDFNNMLTVMMGFAQLSIGKLPGDDPHQSYLREVINAGERAASLTGQLLAFSRQQVLQVEHLNINLIATEMGKLLRQVIGEDIEITTAFDPELGTVLADPSQMTQIILNLATNARDAMPHGGHLTLETANVDLDDLEARRYGLEEGGRHVALTVRDTGHGMDAETQARIFDPFFTTKEVGKGTGLGLATVYGIVKQSGGGIWFESAPGEGTAFKIFLPRMDGSKAASPHSAGPTLPVGTETVLVVEDQEAVRELAEVVLQSAGYTVLAAAGADEALALCRTHAGAIDLLLTDLVMPGMNGRELADRVTALWPQTRVLYMSGYTGDVATRHGIVTDGSPYLQKPFSPGALGRKVRDVLDSSPGTKELAQVVHESES